MMMMMVVFQRTQESEFYESLHEKLGNPYLTSWSRETQDLGKKSSQGQETSGETASEVQSQVITRVKGEGGIQGTGLGYGAFADNALEFQKVHVFRDCREMEKERSKIEVYEALRRLFMGDWWRPGSLNFHDDCPELA